MQHIDNSTNDEKTLSSALRGDYGTLNQTNGLKVRFQGGLIHFQGIFDGKTETIEIPNIPSRIPVMFSGDDFSCCVIVEPNAGFVKVPTLAKGKRFAIFSTAILNT